MWHWKVNRRCFRKKRFEKTKNIMFTLNCQLPNVYLTSKKQINQSWIWTTALWRVGVRFHRYIIGLALSMLKTQYTVFRFTRKQTEKRQYCSPSMASSFLARFPTSELTRNSTSCFKPVHSPSVHGSGTAMPLASCERLRNDNLLTSTFQIYMKLPLILIFEKSRTSLLLWKHFPPSPGVCVVRPP